MYPKGNIFIICILEHILKRHYQETTQHLDVINCFFISLRSLILHLMMTKLPTCSPGPGRSHGPPGHGEDALPLAGGCRDAEDDPDHVAEQRQLLAVTLPPL